ncbi:MAG: hypothetical protein GX442_14530 [Candidatus Riflebacteria bacterium]|nr:hypothetical protein [Candidatus Riflebacteria bacterium]
MAGMTFVEILVASVLLVLVLGGLIYAFTQFRRGYEKGESSAVVLQEGALLMGYLRTDLINAVLDPAPKSGRWQDAALVVSSDRVSFRIFSDDQGHTDQVSYVYAPGRDGGSISRVQGNRSPKVLVNKRVASLTWALGEETAPGVGSGVRRLWLDLAVTLGGQGKAGMTSRTSVLATKLFPVRLNRQLNDGK